jgi:DNA-binding transcriptional LysR family regulator
MIEPRHLKTLRALADHGTVNAAAVALHLTPSAVSQQLTALARTTGCELLERRGRGVVLTKPARILLDHADAILERYERADADLRDYQDGSVNVLRIIGFSTAITAIIAPAVAAVRRERPRWRIQIEEAESEEGLALLLDGEVDVAVVMIAPNRPLLADRRIEREPLLADPYFAVLPDGHPLVQRGGPVDLADLSDDEWIQSRHWTSCHAVIEGACAAAGFQPRVAHYSTDFPASVALVAAGLGVTVIPQLGLPQVPPEGVRILPIHPDTPHRHIAAAMRRGAQYPELLEALRTAAGKAIAIPGAVPDTPPDAAPNPVVSGAESNSTEGSTKPTAGVGPNTKPSAP